MHPTKETPQPRKPRAPVAKEKLAKIRRIRDELRHNAYASEEKLEAILEELIRDVNKRTRR